MKALKLIFLFAHTSCVLFFVTGCSRPLPDVQDKIVSSEFILTASLKSVNEEFNKLPNEAQDNIAKQFTGSYLFLKNGEVVKSTDDFGPILARVQSDFGWDVEGYPDFTTAVSNYLIEQGYDEQRMLDNKSDREWFTNIFENLSKAVRYERL